MTRYELIQIAHTIENRLESFNEDLLIDYVNENFFTFTEAEKEQIIKTTLEEFYALPFC